MTVKLATRTRNPEFEILIIPCQALVFWRCRGVSFSEFYVPILPVSERSGRLIEV